VFCEPILPFCAYSAAGFRPPLAPPVRRQDFTEPAPEPPGWQGQLADLELHHRRRVRCEDCIRNAKDTGLRNLPLKGFA
jgi:hypothetical protein